MFDIGFWELALIAVVAMLVIGPERLPKVARTAGLWVGRMRGFVLSVKADIDKEMRAEELKRIMDEQARSSGLHEIMEETRDSVEGLNKQDDYLVKAMPEDKPAEENAEGSSPSAEQTDTDNRDSTASETSDGKNDKRNDG